MNVCCTNDTESARPVEFLRLAEVKCSRQLQIKRKKKLWFTVVLKEEISYKGQKYFTDEICLSLVNMLKA